MKNNDQSRIFTSSSIRNLTLLLTKFYILIFLLLGDCQYMGVSRDLFHYCQYPEKYQRSDPKVLAFLGDKHVKFVRNCMNKISNGYLLRLLPMSYFRLRQVYKRSRKSVSHS